MPVPKRKRSRPRRDKRFANKGMKIKALVACPQCQTALMPHTACKRCGFYKGSKIMAGTLDRQIKRDQARKEQESRKSMTSAQDSDLGERSHDNDSSE